MPEFCFLHDLIEREACRSRWIFVGPNFIFCNFFLTTYRIGWNYVTVTDAEYTTYSSQNRRCLEQGKVVQMYRWPQTLRTRPDTFQRTYLSWHTIHQSSHEYAEMEMVFLGRLINNPTDALFHSFDFQRSDLCYKSISVLCEF